MENLPKNQDDSAIMATTDLNGTDLIAIKDFEDRGLPNLANITDQNISRMSNLYLTGKTYHDISRIMRVEKPLVMYLSHRFNWFAIRKNYLDELQQNIKHRMAESQLRNKDFLLQILHALEKKIGNKITQYLQTDNENHMNEIDHKDISEYLKTVDKLEKMIGEPGPKKTAAPAVGLNLGDGVTIEKDGDNKVTITPKDKAADNMLQQYADFRREEDRKKAALNAELKNKSKGENNET